MTTATGSRTELMAAIRGLSAARDLPPEVIIDALKAALVSAYHKIPGGEATHVTVDLDESTGESRVFAHYTVVEEEYLEDPQGEMTVAQARAHDADAVIGDTITMDVTPHDFGRIAAQTAKQVILQRIREAEREQTYTTYADREGEIVYGTVQTTNRDAVTVALDRVEALLPKGGQIPGERYTPNQRLRVYVSEVKRSPKGPQVIVSRTHREMLRRLMELEIPEVFQGAVELKAIAREAGSRSKVAVWAHQDGVDPVGACVGMRGVRIQALVRELGGEKIDIVEWDPDPRVFIAHALSPAKVVHVWLEEDQERRTANVIVPDSQLSLAIGREGQNARLAAKLTTWRIDIRAESEASDVLATIEEDEATAVAERAMEEAAAEAAAAAAEAAKRRAELAEAEREAAEAEAARQAEIDAALDEEVAPVEPAAIEDMAVAEDAGDEDQEEAPAQVPPAAETPPSETTPETSAAETPGEERPEGWSEDDDLDEFGEPRQHRRKRRLVRDPKTGELVAQKRRKQSRRRPDWEYGLDDWSEGDDLEDFGDYLEDAMGFTEADFIKDDAEDQTEATAETETEAGAIDAADEADGTGQEPPDDAGPEGAATEDTSGEDDAAQGVDDAAADGTDDEG